MCRINVLTLCALFAISLVSRGEDPKFAQLETKRFTTATAPDLKGGVVFPAGAFDLSGNPEAMIFVNMKAPEGIRFIRVPMTYKGEYTDPGNQIRGHLYYLKNGTYERYFLISSGGIRNVGDPERHVIDYNVNGEHMSYFRGNFAAKP